MKKTTALLLFMLQATMFATAQNTPVTINGALSVKGNQVVNKKGLPPQLGGISLSWSLWAGKKYYNASVG
jgi:endoglucanase